MKYIKRGVATLIPLLLVIQVFLFLGNFSKDLFESMLGQSLEWWMVGVGIVGTLLLTFILGFILTHIKFIRRLKEKVEKKVLQRIPVAGSIYKFGSDIAETFASDVKDDNFTVVEVDMGGFKLLGILTDKENGLGFIISAPSPLTGVVMKLPNYKVLDMSFADAVKINTSLGRINGNKWKGK
jgi:uncharacterized membrane protein